MAMQGARSRLSSLLSRRLLAGNAGAASSVPRRSVSSDSEEDKIVTATLFPGDGIGPEIAVSVKQVREYGLTLALVFLEFWVFSACSLWAKHGM